MGFCHVEATGQWLMSQVERAGGPMRHVAELHSSIIEGGNRKKSAGCMRFCVPRGLCRVQRSGVAGGADPQNCFSSRRFVKTICLSRFRVWWDLKRKKERKKSSDLLLCSCGFHFVLSSRVAWQKLEDVKKTREEDTVFAGLAIRVILNAGSKNYLLFVVVLNLDTSS